VFGKACITINVGKREQGEFDENGFSIELPKVHSCVPVYYKYKMNGAPKSTF